MTHPVQVPEPPNTTQDSLAYLARLATALQSEYRTAGFDPPAELMPLTESSAAFQPALQIYRASANRLASLFDDPFECAASYRSMEEFWADAAEQERGRSLRTYWDTYENGRRRQLEQLAADSFGSEQAVLVNTGMSALDVAIRSSSARPGGTVLVHTGIYFETRELLESVYAPWGLKIATADLTDAVTAQAAIDRHSPTLAIVELVLNGLACDVPVLEPLQEAGVNTVLDCSALGHGVVPAGLMSGPRTIYIESGLKYLSRSASSGVVYGWGDWAANARLCARRTGQQLQGRALHRIRPGEVTACRDRLALHSARRRRFVETLHTCAPELLINDARLSSASREDILARTVQQGADGCLTFVQLPADDGADPELAHRAMVSRWAALSAEPRVRAGFGWTLTSGRSYGRDTLNTKFGECFTRVSVGIEPEQHIDNLAQQMATAAKGPHP